MSLNKISKLYNDYQNFCLNVGYREKEAFYANDNHLFELSYNENPLGPGQKAIQSINKYKGSVNRYPPVGYKLLSDGLSQKLSISEEELIIGSGSLSIINAAIRYYAHPSDEIMYSKSSIPMYKWGVIANGSFARVVPLAPDFNHDLESMCKSLNKKLKIIIIDNPHNPTGLYISSHGILEFIQKIPSRILIVIDQAYIEYVDVEEDRLIKEFRRFPNLLLTRTFSKMYGLAGLRVGYGIANKKVIRNLKAIVLGNVGITNILGHFAACAALNDKDHVQRSKSFNRKMKNYVCDQLKKYEIPYKESQANFVLLNSISSKQFSKKADQHKIKVTPGFLFGYDQWIRMSFQKNMKKVVHKILGMIEEIKDEVQDN